MSENNSNGKLIYFSRIKYDVLVYICNFIKKNSYSPTQKEISKKFRFSRARAGKIVAELKKMNLISLGRSAHRKIRMNTEQQQSIAHLKFNKEYSTHEFR